MEVLVYLVLGLSIWILVPSERSALVVRTAEQGAQGERPPAASDDSVDDRSGVHTHSGMDTHSDVKTESRDR